MQRTWRIVVLSAGFGGAMWVVDATLDALFFYDGSFLSLLLTDVPPHELYVRTVMVASFLLFGLVVARQTALLQTHERDVTLFRTLLDGATDSIFVIDPATGRFLDVNATACTKLGYDRSTFLEMSVPDINDRFRDGDQFGAFIRSADGATLRTYETRHRRADGTTIPVEVSSSTVTIDDREYRIAIARDISERKKWLRQVEVLDRFLRHNLRNDMNVVMGSADEIRRLSDGEWATYTDRIIDTCEELLATTEKEREVTELLVDSPSVTTIDLVSRVTEAVARVRERHPGAEIALSLPREHRVTAVGRIGRAVEELVENAVVHSDRDTPSVAVRLATDDDTATLTVADDGPGVPAVERRAVGDGDAMNPIEHGQGLGFWLVGLLVRESMGTLSFEDNRPRGSIVSLELPSAE